MINILNTFFSKFLFNHDNFLSNNNLQFICGIYVGFHFVKLIIIYHKLFLQNSNKIIEIENKLKKIEGKINNLIVYDDECNNNEFNINDAIE